MPNVHWNVKNAGKHKCVTVEFNSFKNKSFLLISLLIHKGGVVLLSKVNLKLDLGKFLCTC